MRKDKAKYLAMSGVAAYTVTSAIWSNAMNARAL